MTSTTRAGELLREARRRAGLSQAELGRRCGVPRPVIWSIEHGKRQPSFPTVAKILEGAGAKMRIELVPLARNRELPDLERERRKARQVLDVLTLAESIEFSKRAERALHR